MIPIYMGGAVSSLSIELKTEGWFNKEMHFKANCNLYI